MNEFSGGPFYKTKINESTRFKLKSPNKTTIMYLMGLIKEHGIESHKILS